MSEEDGKPSAPPRVLVCIPTYRERDNLEILLPAVLSHAPAADVLVIDDSSPDGTAGLVTSLAAADPRIRLLLRPAKLGLGSALLAGMRRAIDEGYGLLVTMDADLSHDPAHLPALTAGMARHDVMIGSRYAPGGRTSGWPVSRLLISHAVNLMTRLLLRLRARDASGGYRCYRVALLREAGLDRILSRGYSFQQEVLYRCQKAGCRVGETPIHFEERRAGSSKADLAECVRSMAALLSLGVPAFLGLDS
jgi:dolichol-phosphate mannosyltransferase